MSALKDIQQSFQEYLLEENIDAIIPEVVSTVELPADLRLSIYGNAYQSRLVEALASNYIFLKKHLGDDAFQRLALAYIKRFPSTFRSIRWLGNQLPAFIGDQENHAQLTHLQEIASLDWIMTLVFDAKDAPAFTFDQMAAIPPDDWVNMRCIFHPSLHSYLFQYNIVPYWQAQMHDDHSLAIEKYPNAVQWLFWRHEFNTHYTALTAEEAWALDAAIQHASFSEICEGLCAFMDEDNVAMAAATLLKKWIHSGLITNITY